MHKFGPHYRDENQYFIFFALEYISYIQTNI